ncbi:MAG: IPT/TIG domain-containing protein [Planctomycetes bacterium]|nr:IPT/TIG domain-containing protein [Planctomycetota bacterium]
MLKPLLLCALALSSFSFAFAQDITSVAPASVSIGTTITIQGSGFGTKKPSVFLTTEGSTKKITLKVTSYSDTQIEAVASTGTPGTFDVNVKSGNTTITEQDALTLGVPVITQISPGSATPGATVTLVGSLFGATKGKLALNGKTVNSATWTDTSVTFVLPSNAVNGGSLISMTTKIGTGTAGELLTVTGGANPPASLGNPKVECTINGAKFKAKLVLGSKFGNAYNFTGTTTGSNAMAVGILAVVPQAPIVLDETEFPLLSQLIFVETATATTWSSSNTGGSKKIFVTTKSGDSISGFFQGVLTVAGKPDKVVTGGSFVLKPQSF